MNMCFKIAKMRQGFVTNSSSTSYTCDITGHRETFHDSEDHRDYDFVICEGWMHTFLYEFLEPRSEDIDYIRSVLKRIDKENKYVTISKEEIESEEIARAVYKEIVHDLDGDVEKERCPICQMRILSNSDVVKYLELEYGIDYDEVFEYIKSKNKRRKKVYNHEYVSYGLDKIGLNIDELLEKIKSKFKNYDEFVTFLRGKKQK